MRVALLLRSCSSPTRSGSSSLIVRATFSLWTLSTSRCEPRLLLFVSVSQLLRSFLIPDLARVAHGNHFTKPLANTRSRSDAPSCSSTPSTSRYEPPLLFLLLVRGSAWFLFRLQGSCWRCRTASASEVLGHLKYKGDARVHLQATSRCEPPLASSSLFFSRDSACFCPAADTRWHVCCLRCSTATTSPSPWAT